MRGYLAPSGGGGRGAVRRTLSASELSAHRSLHSVCLNLMVQGRSVLRVPDLNGAARCFGSENPSERFAPNITFRN